MQGAYFDGRRRVEYRKPQGPLGDRPPDFVAMAHQETDDLVEVRRDEPACFRSECGIRRGAELTGQPAHQQWMPPIWFEQGRDQPGLG